MTDKAVPSVGPLDVLIEVRRAGICGTDIHIWRGEYALARFPMVPGHEFSGVVTAVGDEVVRVRVGDRVTADPNIPCGRCLECQRNAFNQCLGLSVVGVTRDGAFARYVAVPESVTFPIGDISFADGALIEPLACVVWGLKQVAIEPGDSMLLFGAGPMGCLLMQAARTAGAVSITVVETSASRLAQARALGATHALTPAELTAEFCRDAAPNGFDIVTDVTGVPAVIESTMQYVRPQGKIWVFGVAPDTATIAISPYAIFRKDIKIIGSFALNKTFSEAIALIRYGAVKVAPLVSHSFPIHDFHEGLRVAEHDPNRMKVQFVLSD
ncbi:MAG: alcohol dehydrogenase catalytic domain-containing protein [Truepera sp.]|nr:alcohol dehydrogenase catalytic domain-containing protein [Truepera sp.]